MKQAKNLINLCADNHLSLAFAESVTCGLASYYLSTVEGTSDVFKGSVICYEAAVKTDLFRIRPELLKMYTPESQMVTNMLAENLCDIIPASVCCAITGLASKGGSETIEKPVGTVFISCYFKKRIFPQHFFISGTSEQIQKQSCRLLYDFIWHTIRRNK